MLAGCGSSGVVTIGPGESLNAAAKRAGRDGIVKLQAGNYPAQTVNTGQTGDCYTRRLDAQTRDCRTFLVPQGVKVRMGNLRVEGSGTAILATRGDLEIAGLYTLGPSSENVVRGAIIDPADGDPGIYLGQASKWAVYDTEVKGVTDNDGVDWMMGRTEAEKHGPTPGVPGAGDPQLASLAERLGVIEHKLDELLAVTLGDATDVARRAAEAARQAAATAAEASSKPRAGSPRKGRKGRAA